MENKRFNIVWLRNDLRVEDNPALKEALEDGLPLMPLFIMCEKDMEPWSYGKSARWWLHYALKDLEKDLQKIRQQLRIIKTDYSAVEVFKAILAHAPLANVYCNQCVEPFYTPIEKQLNTLFKKSNVSLKRFNGNYLFNFDAVLKDDKSPYKVYTAFWKKTQSFSKRVPCLLKERSCRAYEPPINHKLNFCAIDDLALLEDNVFGQQLKSAWMPTVAKAHKYLEHFLEGSFLSYDHQRDFPAEEGTSRLSPYLRFGQISPAQIWQKVSKVSASPSNTFCKELIWREFAAYMLFHFPSTTEAPLRKEFEFFQWQKDDALINAWKEGKTGYPVIDAGMRQLKSTGWMHNRVRMIVGSFLVKHLMQHWLIGAHWFWEYLVDADLASNSFNWQWVAGCGADAAPFFRIFNPILQSKKFDPQGVFIKTYVPELQNVSAGDIHEPWKVKNKTKNYPAPIVDLALRRKQALTAYDKLKYFTKKE